MFLSLMIEWLCWTGNALMGLTPRTPARRPDRDPAETGPCTAKASGIFFLGRATHNCYFDVKLSQGPREIFSISKELSEPAGVLRVWRNAILIVCSPRAVEYPEVSPSEVETQSIPLGERI